MCPGLCKKYKEYKENIKKIKNIENTIPHFVPQQTWHCWSSTGKWEKCDRLPRNTVKACRLSGRVFFIYVNVFLTSIFKIFQMSEINEAVKKDCHNNDFLFSKSVLKSWDYALEKENVILSLSLGKQGEKNFEALKTSHSWDTPLFSSCTFLAFLSSVIFILMDKRMF